MINFVITNSLINSDLKNFNNIINFKNFKIAYEGKCQVWKNENKEKFFFFVRINRIFKKKDLEDPKKSKTLEGAFIVLKVSQNNVLDLWTDKFSKEDIFYTSENNHYYISTSLENIDVNSEKYGYDKYGISQSLIIYGNRPSKKNTFYKNIKRLGYYETLNINNKKINIKTLNLELVNSENYTKNHINEYFDTFIESLEKNSSKDDNIVFLSSGWDSTSILAGLRHIYGRKKIRCLIVQQNFSKKYGITNLPELNRAKKFAEYYGVKLDVLNLNYLSEKFIFTYLDKVNKICKSKNFNLFPIMGQYLLAEKAAEIRNATDTTVFTGEMSDGAHNLGFSQFTTIFHQSSKSFREYSDKMMSYLFGPTFLKNIENKNFDSDPVWKILREKFNGKIEELSKKKNFRTIKNIFLRSFFAQSTRFPNYSLDNEPFLTIKGRADYNSYMKKNYINDYAKKLNSESHYSVFLNLYNSFHWQGSSVASLKACADFHNLNICNPFHDLKMFDFLSKMPESWGRGLDLNSTKYPLKEILKEKLNYPIHLQAGAHAYVYDTIFTYNQNEELITRSNLPAIAKQKLTSSKILNNLDKKHFNIRYINKLIQKYKKNQKLHIKEINELSILIGNTLIDAY